MNNVLIKLVPYFALVLFLSLFSDRSKMWKVKADIKVDDSQLTCECRKQCAKPDAYCVHGARYQTKLSREFPHFEVSSNIPQTR